MEFKTMETSALEERKTAISQEMEVEGADLDALLEEVRSINEELESRKAEEAKKIELREMVAQGAGEVQEEIETEEKREETKSMEVRNSVEYINAFANYVKTGKDEECRALLSTNAEANGQVPVPEYIEGRIRTAWERSEVMNLVRKTYLRGNVKVGFELSATGAVVHKEGADAPTEEVLTFGIVTMIPENIKKWITISDEAIDLGGREFLDYIYDELTYRIAKEAEKTLLQMIADAPTTSSATAVGVPSITGTDTLAVANLINAQAALSGDARNLVLVTNRSQAAALRLEAIQAAYAYDPFDGLRVVYTDDLPDGVLAIVGDFGAGAQANFPNGDEIRVIRDDYSLAEKDLVKFVGREYVGMGLVAPNAFCTIKSGE